MQKIRSVPEYFEKRFASRKVRYAALLLILAYIFYYISYNLYTISFVIHFLFAIPPIYTVPLITLFLGTYVTIGGQTAVIFTDLFQGLMLYLAGFLVAVFGIAALGGLTEFWSYLPVDYRLPFTPLRSNPSYNAIGVFCGDALVGSVAFMFMNQGVLMRFLSTKSVKEARKSILFMTLVSLPLSATTVGVAGWIARSIITKQSKTGAFLPGGAELTISDSYYVFMNVAFETLKNNEILLGVVIAALLAALMSTVDTLINASAAIGVYDIYKPLVKKPKSETHFLKVARLTSVIVILISLLLTIWFYKQRGTLMIIHYKGILTIIPPVVAAIFMGLFWPRFSAKGALPAMVLGSALTVLTGIFPAPVIFLRDFFYGTPELSDPTYFRALFGVLITVTIGIVATWLFDKKTQGAKNNAGALDFNKSPPSEPGLTAFTLNQAMAFYKQGEPNHACGKKVKNLKLKVLSEKDPEGAVLNQNEIMLHKDAASQLKAKHGDIIYISDSRWYLGGVRSGHFKLKAFHNEAADLVLFSHKALSSTYMLPERPVFAEKII